MSALLESVAVLALVLVVPGWAAARTLDMDADVFARVWLGLGVTSIVGLQLAKAGAFSLPAVFAVLAAFSVACVVLGWLRTRLRIGGASSRVTSPVPIPNISTVRAIAFVAGLAAFLGCWPPFETVIAASDSTMYVNAGIHLARTGALDVTDTIMRLIWPFTARMIFPSVGSHGFGPIIRLPGGLLMTDIVAHEASPAFFPLLSVWAGIMAAAGGAAAAPAIAPILVGLAVWAVVLFAGETLGVLAAAAAALLLIGNFAFWWFGRFALAEPLACALLWGGLVVLGRAIAGRAVGAAIAAGALVGLAGLARTETFLFVAGAGTLWCLRERIDARIAIGAIVGFAGLAAHAASIVLDAPSHHVWYLRNDFFMHYLALRPRIVEAWQDGTLLFACGLVSTVVLTAGMVGRRRGAGFARAALSVLALLALAVGLLIYVRLAGQLRPARHLGWLAVYCSWPMLLLAPIGGVLVWRRGAAARLAVILALLVTVVFVLNPRVALYQPWAIRRFLPVTIPAVTIAAAATLARLANSRRRTLRGLAVAAALGIALIEARPILAARARPYFAGSFASMAELAARFPSGAIVAIEASFADLQFQVPLWLVHGRETMMMRRTSLKWGEVMRSLLMSGRPVYWIDHVHTPALSSPDLVVRAMPPDLEIRVPVPDAPADALPRRVMNRLVPLRIYEITLEPQPRPRT